ncbi:MAG: DUF6090 family protein [Salibacteraceae bacterium]
MSDKRKINWTKISGFTLETIGIIASILVAFAIENWDEDQRKIEKEEIYLISLHSDMIKDQNQLTRRIKDYEIKLSTTVELMEKLNENVSIDESEIIKTIDDRLAYLFAYVPSNNTYKALESSGDIKFISNAELKILLFELDKSFQTNQQKGELFMDYTNSLMWAGFLIDHFNYQNYTTNLTEQNLRLDLFNRVKRYNKLIEAYYYDMQGTILKLEEVRIALEKEIEAKEIETDIIIEEINVNDKEEQSAEEEELEGLLNEL